MAYCPNCGAGVEGTEQFCGSCGQPITEAPSDYSLGGYVVVGVIGRGATGAVYLATDPASGRQVALKVLDPALTALEGYTERLEAEAAVLSQLSDPHLVTTYGVGQDQGQRFLVMEYVEGASLRAVFDRAGRLSAEQALGVIAGALEGLDHAHAQGVVHGDIKPENIVVDRAGSSKLVDFSQAVSTGETTVGGTPAYMSPEAARGLPLDARSDLYSMGVVLYEALAGTVPFRAANDLALLRLQVEAPPPPVPGLPDQAAFLLDRALAKDPDDRPQSAAVFLAELERAAASAYGRDWRNRAAVAALAAGATTGVFALEVPAAGAPLADQAAHQAHTPSSQALRPGPRPAGPPPGAVAKSGFVASHPVLSALTAAVVVAAAVTGGVLVVGGKGNAPAVGTTTSSPTASASRPATWTQLTSSANAPPPGRTHAAMAYDAADGYSVLFGGTTKQGALGDTWIFKDDKWSKLTTTPSPPARYGASIAYDAADGYIVLFGGIGASGAVLGDTWIFQNGKWKELTDLTSPPPRQYAAMTYDAADGYVVLFGGSYNNLNSYLQDTWAFRAGQWKELNPTTSPSPRGGSSLVYDSADHHVVMFGGTANFHCVCGLDDTWQFLAGNWIQLSPPSAPTTRYSYSFAYDTAIRAPVFFGGWNANGNCGNNLNDTWEFTDGNWIKLSLSLSPSQRQGSATDYDPHLGGLLLFGGANGSCTQSPSWFNDTWILGHRNGVPIPKPIAKTPSATTAPPSSTTTSTTPILTPSLYVSFSNFDHLFQWPDFPSSITPESDFRANLENVTWSIHSTTATAIATLDCRVTPQPVPKCTPPTTFTGPTSMTIYRITLRASDPQTCTVDVTGTSQRVYVFNHLQQVTNPVRIDFRTACG